MPIREEVDMRETFDARYHPAMLAADCVSECEAVGTDYGNNGFTTIGQADLLIRALDLRADDVLLDIGSGSGWPGLYIAQRTGCAAVVTDLTLMGMQQAARRAAADGLAARAPAVVASGRHLPFRPGSFAGIVHTDLLCCLTAKFSVLRATRRLLRPGGRTAFFTIYIAPGVSRADHRRAAVAGPPAVTGPDAAVLLSKAGLVDVHEQDVSDDYLTTARAWRAARLEHRDELRAVDPTVYDERMAKSAMAIAAIEGGLLRRSLYTARRAAD